MPRLSFWFIGAALSYLLAGATAGASIMILGATGYQLPSWLLPLHIEFMLIGWSVQLAMGVAYWVLPRHKSEPARGNQLLARGAFVILNAGVLLAGLGRDMVPILGHGAELVGALAFAGSAWQRLPRSIAPRGKSLPIVG